MAYTAILGALAIAQLTISAGSDLERLNSVRRFADSIDMLTPSKAALCLPAVSIFSRSVELATRSIPLPSYQLAMCQSRRMRKKVLEPAHERYNPHINVTSTP